MRAIQKKRKSKQQGMKRSVRAEVTGRRHEKRSEIGKERKGESTDYFRQLDMGYIDPTSSLIESRAIRGDVRQHQPVSPSCELCVCRCTNASQIRQSDYVLSLCLSFFPTLKRFRYADARAQASTNAYRKRVTECIAWHSSEERA